MAVVGLEVFYSTIQNEISSSEDALVGLLHWLMINNGYICIGKGETVPTGAQVRESERLPRDWDGEQGVYCLLYRLKGGGKGGGTFLFKVISLEDCLLVNLMRHKDNKVADMTVNVRTYCTGDLSSYDKVYKTVEDLHNKLRAEVLSQFEDHAAGGIGTERQPRGERREPEGGEVRQSLRARDRPPPDVGAGADPFAVGRGDLDPLHAGVGGGMIMDPLRAGGLPSRDIVPGGYPDSRIPRGSVPPGARYDPIGPPDFDTGPDMRPRGGRYRGGPDRDHMRPPGFEDNMFM